MPTKRYLVTLTPDEREQLNALTKAGRRSARTITPARILLLTDQADGGPAWEDRRAAEARLIALACEEAPDGRRRWPGRWRRRRSAGW